MPAGTEVRCVDRAATLMIALGELEGEAGVADLARDLGLHKSTTARLLATLQKHGLVERSGSSGKYRLGLVFIRLGEHAEKSLNLPSIAAPELGALARTVHETATLEVLADDGVLTLAYSDASGTVRDETGRNSPLHATAPGKVLLASQPEREVMRLSRNTFTPYTSNTIVRVDLLLQELARVRRRGFSTSFGEYEPAVNAIAVPVFDHRAAVVAALEVRGAGTSITPNRIPSLVECAREAAAAITSRIGGVAASPI